MLKVNANELAYVTKYIHRLTGIVLSESKAYLLESRLGPLLQEYGFRNYRELCENAEKDSSHIVRQRIIDAITTKETFFFRDTAPFELLRHKIFPEMIHRLRTSKDSKNRLRIWSAACSTGQEVYSLEIILTELLSDIELWDIHILGTDISEAAITRAKSGQYNRTEIGRGLNEIQLRRYFINHGKYWQVRNELKKFVSFEKQNLLKPFTGMKKFDLILCRNVAIYFAPANRALLFRRIATQLNPGGILMIGSSETLSGADDCFERKDSMKSIYYSLKEQHVN